MLLHFTFSISVKLFKELLILVSFLSFILLAPTQSDFFLITPLKLFLSGSLVTHVAKQRSVPIPLLIWPVSSIWHNHSFPLPETYPSSKETFIAFPPTALPLCSRLSFPMCPGLPYFRTLKCPGISSQTLSLPKWDLVLLWSPVSWLLVPSIHPEWGALARLSLIIF